MHLTPPQPLSGDQIARANGLGLTLPAICLPRQGLDFQRWAVIACDQFTSQPDYWLAAADYVGQAPSTLHMILPELYLEHPGDLPVDRRIAGINAVMDRYLADSTLYRLPAGWIAVDRSTPDHPSRKGLVLAVDLDCYDFRPGNRQLIRATEGTVLDRIPPRLAIRRDAPLELPHVQLLIDDPRQTVIEPLLASATSQAPLYDTELMLDGGHVRGWFIPGGSPAVSQALEALARLESLQRHGLLFAVGDGNHSLATAKAHWDALRGRVAPDHPARYALVEVVNIHDPGLAFEPIHRVVFNAGPADIIAAAERHFVGQGLAVREISPDSPELDKVDAPSDGTQTIPMRWCDRAWLLTLNQPRHSLTAGSLQVFLDEFAGQSAIRIDYIHGGNVVRELAGQGNPGLLLPRLDKGRFFASIAADGILPRKTFSMGEAREKRYYFECRQIR